MRRRLRWGGDSSGGEGGVSEGGGVGGGEGDDGKGGGVGSGRTFLSGSMAHSLLDFHFDFFVLASSRIVAICSA